MAAAPNNEDAWMSEGEEDDHHFEYYFDNERGMPKAVGKG